MLQISPIFLDFLTASDLSPSSPDRKGGAYRSRLSLAPCEIARRFGGGHLGLWVR